MSLRDQILAVNDRSNKVIDVPEWGVKVELRSMSAASRIQMISEAYDPNTGQTDLKKLYPLIIVSTCFDPKTNEAIFSDADKDAIMEKSADVIERLANEAMGLSGMNESSLTDSGKEMLGNPSADSSMS